MIQIYHNPRCSKSRACENFLSQINQPYETLFQAKLKSVLDKGWYILGNEVEQFENHFADYCGTKFCIGVGNGLDALIS